MQDTPSKSSSASLDTSGESEASALTGRAILVPASSPPTASERTVHVADDELEGSKVSLLRHAQVAGVVDTLYQDAQFVLHQMQPVVSHALAIQHARKWNDDLPSASSKLVAMADRPAQFGTQDLKTCIENVDKASRPSILNDGSIPALFYAVKHGKYDTVNLLLLHSSPHHTRSLWSSVTPRKSRSRRSCLRS